MEFCCELKNVVNVQKKTSIFVLKKLMLLNQFNGIFLIENAVSIQIKWVELKKINGRWVLINKFNFYKIDL